MTDSDAFAEMYGEFCDVVERAWQRWPHQRGPDEAPVLHTSDYARDGANRILAILAEYGDRDGADPLVREWARLAREDKDRWWAKILDWSAPPH